MKKKIAIISISFLISHVLQADTEPFYFPIRNGDLEKVEAFINEGYDVNKPIFNPDITPLVQATSDVRIPIMKALLKAGADPNPCSDSHCGVPLFVHAFAGTRYNPNDPHWPEITNDDVIKAFELLIDYGADVNQRIHLPGESRSYTLVKFLEKSKNYPDEDLELINTLLAIIKKARHYQRRSPLSRTISSDKNTVTFIAHVPKQQHN